VIKIENTTYNKTDSYSYNIPLNIGNLKLVDFTMKDRVRFGGFKVDKVLFEFEAKYENTVDGIYNQILFTASFQNKNKSNGLKEKEILKSYLLEKIPRSWEVFDLPEFYKNQYAISFFVKERYLNEQKPIINYFNRIIPILKSYSKTNIRAFLCHSSEDKPIVEKMAMKLRKAGSNVWFDKWEIKVGESIVEKIDAGLSEMTHLLVFLSKSSIKSNWVKKELSSALMRKLSDNSVSVLPILVEDVKVPTIIIDIKYADFRTNTAKCIDKLVKEIVE